SFVVRWTGLNRKSAIVDRNRRLPVGPITGQIRVRDKAIFVAHQSIDLSGQLPAVKVIGAFAGYLAQRLSQFWLPQDRPDSQWDVAENGAPRRVQPRQRDSDLFDVEWVKWKSLFGVFDRGCENPVNRHSAILPERLKPAGNVPGNQRRTDPVFPRFVCQLV